MQDRTARWLKILKADYCWHPDFKVDDQGKPIILSTGNWVVEWVIKEQNNNVLEHYTEKFSTEKEAQDMLQKINTIGNQYLRYKRFSASHEIHTLGKLTSRIDCMKKRLILKDPRSE